MPPKAHAKAKAAGKAKARPVRLHRPAARMRRPAAREGLTLWEQGLEGPLCDIPPMALRPGALLVVTEGDYFGEKIQVAGEVMKLEVDQGDTTVQLRLKGTRSEAILRVATANPQKLFHCHVCPAGCPRQAVGDFLIHGVRGRPLDRGKDEGWTGNLEAGEAEAGAPDEMEELRRRSQHLAQEAALPGGRAPGEADRGAAPREAEEDKREAKSKKKKKKDKREKDYTNGRHPAVAVQKDLKDVFSGTGLDPRERQRRRVLSGARKFASSKKAKSSSQSSDSNTSSSSSTHEDYKGQETVFSEETKVKGIAERFPGALTMEAVTSMRQSLLTTSGEDLEDRGVRPIATLYYRSILACRTTGVQSRELLNLSVALDCLLRGKIASAADILSQRLKAQESVAQGTSWAIAQRLEVPPTELGGLVATTELNQARLEDYNEAKTRWRTQMSSGAKGEYKGKGKGQKSDTWRKDEKREEKDGKKGKGKEKK